MGPISESDVIRLELHANNKYLNILEACIADMVDRVDTIPKCHTLAYIVTLAVHETYTNIVGIAYAVRIGSIKAILRLADKPRRPVIDLSDTGLHYLMLDVQPPNLV